MFLDPVTVYPYMTYQGIRSANRLCWWWSLMVGVLLLNQPNLNLLMSSHIYMRSVLIHIYIYLYNCIILYIIIYIHKHKVQIYLYTCTVMTSLSRTRGIPMCCSSVLDAVWGRVFGGVHAGLRQGERKALVARGGQTGAVARHPVGWWFFTIRLGF